MEWGSKMDMLLQMQEQGQEPPALRNKPKLLDRLQWYFECFYELTGDRGYTQGYPLGLSTRQIYDYWSIFGLYNFDDFYSKLKLIDRIWLQKTREKSEKESNAKQTPKGSAPPRLQSG